MDRQAELNLSYTALNIFRQSSEYKCLHLLTRFHDIFYNCHNKTQNFCNEVANGGSIYFQCSEQK